MNLLLVSIGGAMGAVCRYLLGLFIVKQFPSSSFPVAMLIVNIIGSFGLGFFYGSYYGGIPVDVYGEPFFLFLAVGFFGAFTTFSTFSMESLQLIQKRRWKSLVVYISLTIMGSIVMLMIGINVMS